MNGGDDAGGVVSARSRFKEIPVDPSILQYIKRVGVGREGKENRRKKRPFDKKKKNKIRNDEQQYGAETMSRDEERNFLENGRVARRSGVRFFASSGGRQQRQRQQSPSPSPHLLPIPPPPPFGDAQPQRRTVTRRPDEDNNINDDSAVTTRARNIRVLPVKVLGRVTSSSLSRNGDSNTDVFPRPSSGLPEVAIVGRSNVGKSTLLNALLYSGRRTEDDESEDAIKRRNKRLRSRTVTSQTAKMPKGLKAKTSSKPGETRSIDFYQLSAEIEELGHNDEEEEEEENSKGFSSPNKNKNTRRNKKKSSLLLVDLPGYGFAFGPKKERKQAIIDGNSSGEASSSMEFLFPWQSLIETYITDRPRSSLKRVLLLVDARHGMKQADSHFLASLQNALTQRQRNAGIGERVPTELPPLQIVLTKCDLVSQVDLARRVVEVREQLSDCLIRQPKMLPEMLVSAQIEGQGGLLELQKELASLCGSR